MKTILLSVFAISISIGLSAQVGINNSAPKATVDITATNTGATTAEGLIAPRLTGNQIKDKDAQYTAAQAGTLIYATSAVISPTTKTNKITRSGYYFFDG